MLTLTKIISAEYDNIKRLVVKFLRYGRGDVQTSLDIGPYGSDSNPIKDMIAVYAPTSQVGETVIVGYLNKNRLAEIGEHRSFSTDAQGNLKTFIWLKNDGTIQLGGTADNVVRFIALDNELQNLAGFINQELQKIATGITGAGGSYTPANCSIDISSAKVDQLKTP